MGNVDFDERLVRLPLHDQHPDLADLDLERVTGGWDIPSAPRGFGPGGVEELAPGDRDEPGFRIAR